MNFKPNPKKKLEIISLKFDDAIKRDAEETLPELENAFKRC